MSDVQMYLDCGCAILKDGGRSWCPTCSQSLATRHDDAGAQPLSDHDELAYQAWGFAFAALAPTRTMEQPPPEWLKLFADATRDQPDRATEGGGRK